MAITIKEASATGRPVIYLKSCFILFYFPMANLLSGISFEQDKGKVTDFNCGNEMPLLSANVGFVPDLFII